MHHLMSMLCCSSTAIFLLFIFLAVLLLYHMMTLDWDWSMPLSGQRKKEKQSIEYPSIMRFHLDIYIYMLCSISTVILSIQANRRTNTVQS